MSVSESQRRQLHADFERTLGTESAAVVMDLLPPAGWGDLVRQANFDAQLMALRAEMQELRAELKGEMAELRTELKGEMAELRTELKGEMAELRAELKGEVSELRVEVRGQARRFAAISAVSVMAASVSTAGLVLAAVSIAH